MPTTPVSHLDVKTTGDLTTSQYLKVKKALEDFVKDSDFSDVSFYINSDYIGGRPNDRG